MNAQTDEIIFTPSNEPYLGRRPLLAFDKLICSCLEVNSQIAPLSHRASLSDHQKAACQLIPQGISIALSIRELIRQGYLFGALTLVRPLGERAAILLYLEKHPTEIVKWNRGWQHNEAPSFSKMVEALSPNDLRSEGFKGHHLTGMLNSVLHGKPDCAVWSLVPISGEDFGHGVSKSLQNPHLCDKICFETMPWLASILYMMVAYFPDSKSG